MMDDDVVSLDSPLALQSSSARPSTPQTKPYLQWNTAYCADSVEFCPIQGRELLLACGTYQLVSGSHDGDHQGKDTRIGRLHLLRLEANISGDLQLMTSLQEINMPGILDVKWFQENLNGQPTLSVADASGVIRLYTLGSDSDVLSVIDEATRPVEDANVLALALDWSSAKQARSEHPLLSMSDSAGGVRVYEVNATGLQQVATWKAHDFEAWVIAFDYSNSNVVFSGGDDAKLKGWDLRQPPTKSTFTSSTHKMGVTSIHSNSLKSCVLATGSYDEQVLIWDTRQMVRPTKSVAVGGGVWRLKWFPDSESHLLAACMHGGAKVLSCESDEVCVRASYLNHDSMVYGIDWCRMHFSSPVDVTIASCSFYDKALHVWEFKSSDLH